MLNKNDYINHVKQKRQFEKEEDKIYSKIFDSIKDESWFKEIENNIDKKNKECNK